MIEREPQHAPDGKRLTWTSNRTGSKQSQIFLANWDHTDPWTPSSSPWPTPS